MQVRRLFSDTISSNPVVLSKDEHRYAVQVLRLKTGHPVELITPEGCVDGIIASIDNQQTRVECLSQPEVKHEPSVAITLFQGLPDHLDKLELIVQKAVELGVSRIVPFTSRYTDAKYRKMDLTRKMDRIRKIAKEAVRQCRRTFSPVIENPVQLEDIQSDIAPLNACFLFFEKALPNSGKPDLSPTQIGLIIGPEGGFADQEVEMLVRYGSLPIFLPGRILRTETAAVACSTLIQAYFGDFRNIFEDPSSRTLNDN